MAQTAELSGAQPPTPVLFLVTLDGAIRQWHTQQCCRVPPLPLVLLLVTLDAVQSGDLPYPLPSCCRMLITLDAVMLALRPRVAVMLAPFVWGCVAVVMPLRCIMLALRPCIVGCLPPSMLGG